MPKTLSHITSILSLTCLVFLSSACNKDDDDDANTSPSDGDASGKVEMRMTDAPAEDANVQATFVTVSSIELDGETFEGFTAQTIEISAYQNGESKLLLNEDIAVGSYSEVTLIFNHETDASGNSPGSYVLTTDGEKHALNTAGNTSSNVTLSESFEMTNGGSQELIIDLDLRKSIQRQDDGAQDQYEFVSSGSFDGAFRMHRTNTTGMVSGTYQGSTNGNETLVVYAYQKGSYSSAEEQADAESSLRFTNATTSGTVDAQGNYTLAFLPEGEYELVMARYTPSAEGRAEFDAKVSINLFINGSIFSDLTVDAESSLTVDLGIL